MSDNINLLKNYLLYFLLMILVCVVGVSGVFADTLENIGYLDENSDVLVEVSYTSSPLPLERLGEYQLGQVEAMNINVSNFTFNAGTTYSLEFFTSKTPLTYANAFTVVGNSSNNQPVTCSTVGITYDDIKYLNFRFNCPSTVNYINLRIFNSSNNYIMDTGLFTWSYVYLRKVTSSTDTSILESQNAQIIQGQQDIINNQNANTDKEIKSQRVCSTQIININSIKDDNKYLNDNGDLQNSNTFGTTDYIEINQDTVITLENRAEFDGGRRYCFYNEYETKISCGQPVNISIGTKLTIPNNAKYIRFTISKADNLPKWKIENCKNGNQALNDSITGLNDSLNDDDSSGATSEASEFFNSFTTNTFGLTSIITAPLNLIQSLTSSTCSELHLPLPYLNNKYLDLPCMTTIYQTHFGAFFTMYQTITYGIIAYWVIVRIFNQVKDFKNPEHDEIEVVDL